MAPSRVPPPLLLCSWALGTLIYEMMGGAAPFEGEDQMDTFRNILHGKLEFPDPIAEDADAVDLISQLLARDVVDRLGCRKDGAEEIFRHRWFASVDWAALQRKEVPAPWLPELAADDDARYFESYEDEEDDDEEEEGGDADGDDEGVDDVVEEDGEDVEGEDRSDGGDGEDDEEGADDEDTFAYSESIPEHLIAERERLRAAGAAGGKLVRGSGSSNFLAGSRSARSSGGGTESGAGRKPRTSDRSASDPNWFEGF